MKQELEVQFHLTPREAHMGPHEDLIAFVSYEQDASSGTYLVTGTPWPERHPGKIVATGRTLQEAVLSWIGVCLSAKADPVSADFS